MCEPGADTMASIISFALKDVSGNVIRTTGSNSVGEFWVSDITALSCIVEMTDASCVPTTGATFDVTIFSGQEHVW